MANLLEFLENAGATVSTAAAATATAATAAADRWAEQRVGRSAPTPATATPARSASAPAVVPESPRNPEPARSATTPATATSWTQQTATPQAPQGPQQAPHEPREQRRSSREAEPARSPWSGSKGKSKGKGILPTILGAGLLAGTIVLSVWVQGVLGVWAMVGTIAIGGTIALAFGGFLGDVNKDGKVDARNWAEYFSRALENGLQGGLFSIASLVFAGVLGAGNLTAWLGMGSGTTLSTSMIIALWAAVSFTQGLHTWYFCTKKNRNRTLILLSEDYSLHPDLTDRTAPGWEKLLEQERQRFSNKLRALKIAALVLMPLEAAIVGGGSSVLQSANPMVFLGFLASVGWLLIGLKAWGSFRDEILSPAQRQKLDQLNDDETGVRLRRS